MGLLESMRAWETRGTIGDGPRDVKNAAARGDAGYGRALDARYLLNRPNFDPPRTDAGVPDQDGPRPHGDPFSSGEKRWQNFLDQQTTSVSAWRRPNPSVDWQTQPNAAWKTQVRVIGEALREAAAAGRRIRPIGGAHAAGDVCKPDEDGQLIQLDDCDPVRDTPYLAAGNDRATLAWVGGGTRIADLNAALAARGQAMLNMGGYNGQTAAGALCTGTHGSGLDIPALNGVIRSIWIVVLAADGQPELRVVEPSDGTITDRDAFEADTPGAGEPLRRLIRDDLTFQAVCQGVGWTGVVYAMTLLTARSYWLVQTKAMTTYTAAKKTFLADIAAHRHFEWALSPLPCWQADGTWDHSCLTVRRDLTSVGQNPRWPTNRFMGWADDIARGDPNGVGAAARLLEGTAGVGGLGAFVHNTLARMQVRAFASAPPNILLLPYGNHFRAKSCEVHFRLADSFPALDTILGAMRRFAAASKPRVVNSPCGVRVVKRTPGPLSTYDWGDDSPTVTIELPILLGARDTGWGGTDADRLLLDIFASLGDARIPARLHWGQYHRIDRGQMLSFYGDARVAAFERVRKDFDPKGLFGNVASDRLRFR